MRHPLLRSRGPRVVRPLLALPLAACAMSRQQEVAMGDDYAAQIEARLPMVKDQEVNGYLHLLGDSLARVADRQGLTWRFRLVNTREVNAFAIPGGHVYVTRGLVERTATMGQLAGVLAHEIAHVTRRHSVQQMEKAQRADFTVSLVCVLTGACESQAARAAIQVGGSALFARYSREDEAEADADAVGILVRAGIHPRGIPEMFELLIAERQRQPGALDAWFATHPTEEARIASTRRLIAALPPSALAGLASNAAAFDAFRRRIRTASIAARE